MTPDAIADLLLQAVPHREFWKHKVQVANPHTLTEIVFTPPPALGFLNLSQIAAVFNSPVLPVTISWQNHPAELDSPCVVFKGGIHGTLVQAVIVVKSRADG
jgi:hypothetical protein